MKTTVKLVRDGNQIIIGTEGIISGKALAEKLNIVVSGEGLEFGKKNRTTAVYSDGIYPVKIPFTLNKEKGLFNATLTYAGKKIGEFAVPIEKE